MLPSHLVLLCGPPPRLLPVAHAIPCTAEDALEKLQLQGKIVLSATKSGEAPVKYDRAQIKHSPRNCSVESSGDSCLQQQLPQPVTLQACWQNALLLGRQRARHSISWARMLRRFLGSDMKVPLSGPSPDVHVLHRVHVREQLACSCDISVLPYRFHSIL